MKQVMLAVLFLMVGATLVMAENIVLTNPEVLSVPTATKIELRAINIDATSKRLTVSYRWLDVGGSPIRVTDSPYIERTWTCTDIETPGTNAECLLEDDPYPCCTGLGTGTCDGMDSTCFTDTFSFVIRSQDVGKKIGVGLRDLIWAKMKAAILTAGNTGTFE